MPSSQSSALQSFPAPEKFAAPIKCQCGQVGSAVWEDVSVHSSRRTLQDVSSGFYMRMQKKNLSRTEIVCAVCEAVVHESGARK
jgi:hypothetical protein